MDVKDLRTESDLSERSSDGNTNYVQSGPTYQSTEKNKSYHEIGSITNTKVDVQTTRPCAVIGPDRIVTQTHPFTDPYVKRGHVEPWQFTRPPEYPCKPQIEYHLPRNISPRQTFQENMQRVMVPPRHNVLKLTEDHNVPEKNVASSKPVSKVTMTMEAKYCEVPYTTNTMHEQKSVRNSELTTNNVNPTLMRSAPHMWPHGAVNIQPNRPYGGPEYYQYPEYSNCPSQMPLPINRPHRTPHEEAAPMYSDPYYRGSARFEPYPNMKDRYSQPRFEYVSNYTNHYSAPHFSPHKYDIQKLQSGAVAQHAYSNYPQVPIKYFEKIREPVRDNYQRPTNPNMQFLTQGMPPSYGSIPGNCLPGKLYPCPDGTVNTANNTKMPYDSSKSHVNLQPKHYPPPEGYYLNDISRVHHMRPQMPMPNYPSVNVHPMHPYPFYRKDSLPMKHYDYNSQFKNTELPYQNHLARVPSQFSPNIISPSESTASNDTNHSFAISPEDCGYVSQSSTASVRSSDSGSHLYNRYGYINRVSPITSRAQPDSKSSRNKDKKDINVRQFLQMWSEGDDEPSDENHIINKIDNQPTRNDTQYEVVNNHEQLYVLGLVNVPSEELDKYNHIQKVSKLPDNIKGYTSIDLLNQFEEVIESSNLSNFALKTAESKETKVINKTNIHAVPAMISNRPLSPLDVEAKISQSVIHKEVGCNFEIRPCSPKMLNVEVASPIQSVIDERVIEKVSNPLANNTSNCNGVKHQDRRRSFNREDNSNIPSCKMAKTQYSNDILLETDKSSYSIQDLESNSGVCLASLPRLDNDIELSFPEVNQQFINDNRVKSTKVISETNQPIQETNKSNNIVASEVETKMGNSSNYPYSPVGLEFAKLSKYRKNKQSGADHLTQQAIRTDSVIIKNPENIYSANNRQEKMLPENLLSVDVPYNSTKSGSSLTDKMEKNISYYEKGKHDSMCDNITPIFAEDTTDNSEKGTSFSKQLVVKDTKQDNSTITEKLPSLLAETTDNTSETDNESKLDYTTNPEKDTIIATYSMVKENKSIDQLKFECLTESKVDFLEAKKDCNDCTVEVCNDSESTSQFIKEETNNSNKSVSKTIDFDENKNINDGKIKDSQLIEDISLTDITQFENTGIIDEVKTEDTKISSGKLDGSLILLNIDDDMKSAPNMTVFDGTKEVGIVTENKQISEENINMMPAVIPSKTPNTLSKHLLEENEESEDNSKLSAKYVVDNNNKTTEVDYLLEDPTYKLTPNIDSVYAVLTSQNDSEKIIKANKTSDNFSIVNIQESLDDNQIINLSARTELKKETKTPEHIISDTISSEIKTAKLPSEVSKEISSTLKLCKDECDDKTTVNEENKLFDNSSSKNIHFEEHLVFVKHCNNAKHEEDDITAVISDSEEKPELMKTEVDENNETLEQISLFIQNSQENADCESSSQISLEPTKENQNQENKSSENVSSNINHEEESIVKSSCAIDFSKDRRNLKDENVKDITSNIKRSEEYSDDRKTEQSERETLENVSIFIKESEANFDSETIVFQTSTEYTKSNLQENENLVEVPSNFKQSEEILQNYTSPLQCITELSKEIDKESETIGRLNGNHETLDNVSKLDNYEDNIDFLTCSSEVPTVVLKEKLDRNIGISGFPSSDIEHSEDISSDITIPLHNSGMTKVIQKERVSEYYTFTNDLDEKNSACMELTTQTSIELTKDGLVEESQIPDSMPKMKHSDENLGYKNISSKEVIDYAHGNRNEETTMCQLPKYTDTQATVNKENNRVIKFKTIIFNKKLFSWIFQKLEYPQLNNLYYIENNLKSQEESVGIVKHSFEKNKEDPTEIYLSQNDKNVSGLNDSEIEEINNRQEIALHSEGKLIHLENVNSSIEDRENKCIVENKNVLQTTVSTFHSIDENNPEYVVRTTEEPNVDSKNTLDEEQNDKIFCMPRAKLKRSFSDSDITGRNSDGKKVSSLKTPVLKRIRLEDEDTSGTYRVAGSYNLIQNRRNSVSSMYHDEQFSLCILIDDNCIITQADNEEAVCLATIQEGVDEDVFACNDGNIVATDDVGEDTIETLKSSHLEDDVLQTLQIDNVEHESTEDWVDDVACIETVVSDDIDEEDSELYVQGCYKPPHDEMLNRECTPEALCMNEHTNKIRDIYGDEMCNDDYNLINTFYTMPHMNVNKTLSGKESPHYEDSPQNEDESLENILTTSHYGYHNCTELNANLNYSMDDELQSCVEDNMNKEENIEINETRKEVSEDESEKEANYSKITDSAQDSTELSFVNNIDIVNNDKELQYKSTSSSPEVTSTTEEKKSTILLKITNYNGSRISEVNSEDNESKQKIRCKLTEKNDYLSSKSEFRSSRPLITKAAQKYIPPLHEADHNLKIKLFLPQQSLMKLKQLKVSKDEPKMTLQKQNVKVIDKSIKPNIKKVKPLFEDVLKSIDEMQYKKHRDKKSKKFIPKMIIKKTENGSHYTSTSDTSEPFNPDLTGMKWQPWVFIEKNIFIDKMAMTGKKRAMFCRRKNTYVLTENFRKYKSVGSTKFVIRNSTIDSNSTPGPLKCTIKLKTY